MVLLFILSVRLVVAQGQSPSILQGGYFFFSFFFFFRVENRCRYRSASRGKSFG
jgi:hypothetical protein